MIGEVCGLVNQYSSLNKEQQITHITFIVIYHSHFLAIGSGQYRLPYIKALK